MKNTRTTNLACGLLLTVALALSGASCKRSRKAKVDTVEEQPGAIASVVSTNDPSQAIQLVSGFHEVEQGSWRWVKGKFTVTLKAPSKTAATLVLKLAVPEPVIQRVGETALSAKVGGLALEPESYSKPGDYTYTRDVPASALAHEAVTVEFAFSKYLAEGQVEQRELAAIVNSIALQKR